MPVVRKDPDLLGTTVVVVGGEDRGGWANLVHQSDGEEGSRSSARCKVDPIDVGERRKDPIDLIRMCSAVAGEFPVGTDICDLARSPVVTEKGLIAEEGVESWHQAGDSEGDSTALAPTDDGDAPIHCRVGSGRFDCADRVGQDATVIVLLRIEDAACHRAGAVRVANGCGVGRVSFLPIAPLASSVHHEVRVANGAPEWPVGGETAATAIAKKLDDAG